MSSDRHNSSIQSPHREADDDGYDRRSKRRKISHASNPSSSSSPANAPDAVTDEAKAGFSTHGAKKGLPLASRLSNTVTDKSRGGNTLRTKKTRTTAEATSAPQGSDLGKGGAEERDDDRGDNPLEHESPLVGNSARPQHSGKRKSRTGGESTDGGRPEALNGEASGTGTPSSERKRKRYKGWAWVDDGQEMPVNNQDQFQKIAEEAAKAAVTDADRRKSRIGSERLDGGKLKALNGGDLGGKNTPSSEGRRKKHKGWAWVDDIQEIPVNNQDQFQQIAEEAAKAAVTDVGKSKAREPTISAKSLRAKRPMSTGKDEGEAIVKAEVTVSKNERRGSITTKPRPVKSGKINGAKRDPFQMSESGSESLGAHHGGPAATGTLETANDSHIERTPRASQGSKKQIGRRQHERHSSGKPHEERHQNITSRIASPSPVHRSPKRGPSSAVPEEQVERLPKARFTTSTAQAPESIAKKSAKDPPSQDSFSVHASKLMAALGKEPSALDRLKSDVLANLNNTRRLRVMPHLEEQYEKIQQLLDQTILAGEGNSMIVTGSRGSGKRALVEHAIDLISSSHKDKFLVVRLNGFIQTDDKLALREIWRQLGRELDEEEEEEKEDVKAVRSNYADTLTSLLALLSHQEEGEQNGGVSEQSLRSKSVVFILEEFDLFTTHSRQTLLYNLFDVAQSHRNAPIAVLGLTTKVNIVDSLEKRVKSRFSQRCVHVSLPPNLEFFQEVCLEALTHVPLQKSIPVFALASSSQEQELHKASVRTLSPWAAWQNYAFALLQQPEVETQFKRAHHTTNRPIDFMTSYLLPLVLKLDSSNLATPPFPNSGELLNPPDSSLHHLNSLTTLQIALLIAAARLDVILDTDLVTFESVYDEYVSLASRAKVAHQQSVASTSVSPAASGNSLNIASVSSTARVWGRDIALAQWEGLIQASLVVPAGTNSSSGAASAMTNMSTTPLSCMRGDAGLWKIDVGLEEMGAWLESEGRSGAGPGRGRPGISDGGGHGFLSAGTANALGKWCREI